MAKSMLKACRVSSAATGAPVDGRLGRQAGCKQQHERAAFDRAVPLAERAQREQERQQERRTQRGLPLPAQRHGLDRSR